MLNIYTDESESYWALTVGPGYYFNQNLWYQTHKNMTLLQLTNIVEQGSGHIIDITGYVHTNYASGSLGSYYVWTSNY